MKKISLIIVCVVMAFVASAQFRYAPVVGYNNSTLNFNQKLIDVKSASGFHAGVNGELMFPGIGFGIDIGAKYVMQGAEVDLGQKEIWASDGYGKSRLYLHNLEIPVNLKFKWTRMQGLEDYIAPYVFGGPTFSFLLAHSNIKAFSYNVLTIGLQVGIGFELYKCWHVQGCMNWGMSNSVRTIKLDDFAASNRTWSISVLRYF